MHRQPMLFDDLPRGEKKPKTEDIPAPDLVGLSRLQLFTVAAVLVHPDKTSNELAALAGKDPRVINRRLCEVERRGLVIHGPRRICNVTGRVCLTWRMK